MYNRHLHVKQKERQLEQRKQERIEHLNKTRRKLLTQRYMDRVQQWMMQETREDSPTPPSTPPHAAATSFLPSVRPREPFSLSFKNQPQNERIRAHLDNREASFLDHEPFEKHKLILRERNAALEIQPPHMRFDKWRSERERLAQKNIISLASTYHTSSQTKENFRHPSHAESMLKDRLIAESMSHGPLPQGRTVSPHKWIASSFDTATHLDSPIGTERIARLNLENEYLEKACISTYGMSKRFDPREEECGTSKQSCRRNSDVAHQRTQRGDDRNDHRGVLKRPATTHASRRRAPRIGSQDEWASSVSFAVPGQQHTRGTMEISALSARKKSSEHRGTALKSGRASLRSQGSTRSKKSGAGGTPVKGSGGGVSEKQYSASLQDLLYRSTSQRPSSSAHSTLFANEFDVANARSVLLRSGREKRTTKYRTGRRKSKAQGARGGTRVPPVRVERY
mmetsp:Transcript_8498/g.31447  ORF Transcript_8498/g.31447 Transcript_8498/m.31447 type:complete len:454 (-) Transcript_8498:376-1737(-)|eukprot:CAMPEP_0117451998 /NCGR_PEP_ID=MMETSP0759-20121206/9337_1 /TAXON_ID=63605 /ORGANISM="Percolomonas cosmopolitus, Strain WS" /LENGTH=453 /DNA_ID=CAMNT_0005244697 /DNA_START=114 /DNA_END=1475 /DNA_ORIENTATION=+